ncbi:MAG: glycogen debranching protein [Fibrobacter sp.]|nr:glycogen debranching protein [Fibrobacter sp.]
MNLTGKDAIITRASEGNKQCELRNKKRRSALEPIRRIIFDEEDRADDYQLLRREWLVTNGLGGYASGTIDGTLDRRYHALLVAALPSVPGRVVLLNRLVESVKLDKERRILLGAELNEEPDRKINGAYHITEFSLEAGIPVWRYSVEGYVLEKRVFMPHLQNTVHLTYTLVSAPSGCSIELRPFLQFCSHDESLNENLCGCYSISTRENRFEISGEEKYPVLKLLPWGKEWEFELDGKSECRVHHCLEEQRGYESLQWLWTPGVISLNMRQGSTFTLSASCEPWETILALTPQQALKTEQARMSQLLDSSVPEARKGIAAELVIAADQFIITPVRANDAVRTHVSGDEARSVIAGYHWFTDWGRDTMISLEGLTLTTGRFTEAGWILKTFARYIRNGLIPNLFPEGKDDGRYNTADATLWFFHAVHRYIQYTNDHATLLKLLDPMLDIVKHHLEGTIYGIRVDNSDGLLYQGEEGVQLTWMDALVDGWVVTPRRGKAVEINALWYNALMLLEGWVRSERGGAASGFLAEAAQKARRSFNERFWYEKGGYLYDVIDGESGADKALRPNQVLAVSLDYPVLEKIKWQAVVNKVKENLLTPYGLRSLAPGDPQYKPEYFGDLRARDAAYHQGTVWAWLIGPFIDAWLRCYPSDTDGARKFLDGFRAHMGEACVGSISEIFDAEPPFTPRGCIAQAWSVAEVLRCIVKTEKMKTEHEQRRENS